jgi:hypothetical protein
MLYLLSRLSLSVQFVYALSTSFEVLKMFCAMMLALLVNFGPAVKVRFEKRRCQLS